MDVLDSAQRDSSYLFLDCTLDVAAGRLLRGTSEIKLRPKSFQVLRYLVERPGRLVTREELLQTVWGDVAVTDESVTKCIADIRKALGDDSQQIVRTVTRRGFLFQPQVRVGDGSGSLNDPAMPPHEARPPSGRRTHPFHDALTMSFAGIVVFGIVVTAVALRWRGDVFDRRPSFQAIAVLPFENLSSAADQQYVADGLTDALITNLGQASPLRVIGRTSVSRYERTKKSVQEIARELNVDVVVEGTITRSGDRLRATANLIQVSPEKHLWAASYERSSRDALTLQNEIADAIAAEIEGTLTVRQRVRPTPSRRPVNSEAQLAYWKARYFLHGRRETDAASKSIEYSEEAVRRDPSYAPAHAAMATSYLMLSNLGGAFPSEVMPRAEAAAQRAIALDEALAEAHVALASVLLAYDWDWAAAEREARRAVALNPSHADAHQTLANCFAAVGRTSDAVTEIKRARELDPFSFFINRNVGRILYFARQYDEAIGELRQAGDMAPNSFSVVDNWIIRSLLKKGLRDEAIALDLRIRMREGFATQSLDSLRTAYAEHGSRGYWTTLKAFVLPEYRSMVHGPFSLAEIDAFRDDTDEAFAWLEKAYQVRSGRMPWIKVDPALDGLRPDPRFNALLRRMRLTP